MKKYSLFVQRETPKGETGFVPWAHIGFSINHGFLNRNHTSYNKVGAGYVVDAGLRYNFEKFYIGVVFDYNLYFLMGGPDYEYDIGYGIYYYSSSDIITFGIRAYAEIGLRL